jgi:3-dehydroquinate synthetase
LGHTIGHAIELESGFHIRHGEAIGLGMLAESDISRQLGLCQADVPEFIFQALQNLGLPVKLSPSMNPDKIISAMQKDKKKAGGRIKFALPRQIGSVGYGDQVDEHLVRYSIAELQNTDH